MFPPIRYLEWIPERQAACEMDLGSSGLGATQTGVVPDELQGRSDPPEGQSLEAQIASRYGAAVGPDQVLVTAGTSHANLLAIAAALGDDPEDRGTVVVERPGYEPLVATPRGLGARVRRVDREPDSYGLDPARLEGALDERTRLVVLSNRHNPSGHRLSRDDVEALAARTRKYGARLLVDEVYAPYTANPVSGSGTAFGGPTGAGIEGVAITNSLTKFFGFGGLRIGWLVADAPFVQAVRRVSAHAPDVAEPSRALARRAFADLEPIVSQSREHIAANAETLQRLATRTDVRGEVHVGSTFGFLEHRDADGNAVVDAAWEDGILVIPGRFFDDPSRFRISFAGPPSDMQRGLARFEQVLDELAA